MRIKITIGKLLILKIKKYFFYNSANVKNIWRTTLNILILV